MTVRYFKLTESEIESIAEKGAEKALARLGAHSEAETDKLRTDMTELRELLQAWKDVRKQAWHGVTAFMGKILLWVIAGSVGYTLASKAGVHLPPPDIPQ